MQNEGEGNSREPSFFCVSLLSYVLNVILMPGILRLCCFACKISSNI
jgi:hypothetical protein